MQTEDLIILSMFFGRFKILLQNRSVQKQPNGVIERAFLPGFTRTTRVRIVGRLRKAGALGLLGGIRLRRRNINSFKCPAWVMSP